MKKRPHTLSGLLVLIIVVWIIAAIFITQDINAQVEILSINTAASCITSSCHADMGKKKYVHAIGVDGKQCIRCHEILKQGEHSFNKIPPVTFPICAKCHSEEFSTPSDIKGLPPKVIFEDKEMNFHAPFAEGKCTECHDAHESDYFKHLKAEYTEEYYAPYSAGAYALCVKCHKGLEKALTEPRTLTDTRFRNGNLNLHYRHVNQPKGRTCKTCHYHHGSKTKTSRLIRDAFPFGKRSLMINYEKTETGGSCAPACHATVQYDRYEPVETNMKTTQREGMDATPEELRLNRVEEEQGIKEEGEKK